MRHNYVCSVSLKHNKKKERKNINGNEGNKLEQQLTYKRLFRDLGVRFYLYIFIYRYK